MSYAKKAKKGYYGIAEFKDKDGKRYQKSAGFFKLKREALRAGDELERELNKVNLDLRDVTLFDYFKRWFDLYKLIQNYEKLSVQTIKSLLIGTVAITLINQLVS